MSGIVGIAGQGNQTQIKEMLESIAHRGNSQKIIETKSANVGVTWSHIHSAKSNKKQPSTYNWDDGSIGYLSLAKGNFTLKRDPLGVVPLYYGWTEDGLLCFSSEVKGLLVVTRDIHELPPGHTFDGRRLTAYYQPRQAPLIKHTPERIAKELRKILESAVEKHTRAGSVGAWLSGGLDSSVMASLAHFYIQPLHTFAAGMPGSPDIKYARLVANFLQAEHHEIIVKINDLLTILPEVIYHLESFDAWLVRSSIMNYLVARLSADYVPSVFSGEGGDELFAGYEYLKGFNPSDLAEELIDITLRLHNTALQRVDRCSSAHGIIAHVGFLDPDVVDYALRIPAKYKLHNGVEKWILRQAINNDLPEVVVNRPKAKFWQGAGVQELLAHHAEEMISDTDFSRERRLPNGWLLKTKEELLYFRIFNEHFGRFDNLSWMGRTKGSPVQ